MAGASHRVNRPYTQVWSYKREYFKGQETEASNNLRSGPSATGTVLLLHSMSLVKQSQTPPRVKGKEHRLHLSWEKDQRMCELLNLP